MQRQSKIATLALAAAAAVGSIVCFPGHALAGRFSIDINVGALPPPPARHHDEVVVLEYDRYCVGYHRDLYDADWRLRNAQIEQWHAQDALADARHREGEIAVTVDDKEAFVAEFAKRVADSDAALAGGHAAVARAEADADDARARQHAFEKRAQGARDDLEAGRTLHDAGAIEDAQKRIALNEAAAATAAGDVRAFETRAADLRAAEASAAAMNDQRARLIEIQTQLPRLRDDLAAAHEGVYAAQQRLDAAMGSVALALHDRDEALWMLHRDEILSGRSTFASCGFTVDLGVWGGRMPRDPEVVHMYYVHPVTYWVERPVEIQTRVIECDRIVEVSRVREIQEKHEGPRFHEVVTFETNYPVERRREFAERVTVEREHMAAERTERAAALAEHRAPRIPESERVEALAIVAKEHAAEVREGHVEARENVAKEHAEVREAHAEVREAHVEARENVAKEHAEVREEHVANVRAEETRARDDERARAEAKADRRTTPAPSSSSRVGADDRKTSRDPRSAGSDPATDSRKPNSKDPRNRSKDGQASIDPSR